VPDDLADAADESPDADADLFDASEMVNSFEPIERTPRDPLQDPDGHPDVNAALSAGEVRVRITSGSAQASLSKGLR